MVDRAGYLPSSTGRTGGRLWSSFKAGKKQDAKEFAWDEFELMTQRYVPESPVIFPSSVRAGGDMA